MSYFAGGVPDQEVQVLTLHIKKLICSQLMDTEMFGGTSPKLNVELTYRIEMMARQLTACLELPVDVLQNDRLIAEYPDGLWQSVRKALRLKHRTRQVRMNEWLTFPAIDINQYGRAGDTVRVYARPSLSFYDPRKPE
jgi:hypothetical protein